MRTIDDIKRWKGYGFALTPIQDGTKKPKLKDGKWSSDWSDQELLNSERLGFFHKEELNFLNKGKMLGEHPDHFIPGIEVISGSLGHGLSIGAGMALADKFDNKNNRKTFVILGDGECNEGSVWEAAMAAPNLGLNNLYMESQ